MERSICSENPRRASHDSQLGPIGVLESTCAPKPDRLPKCAVSCRTLHTRAKRFQGERCGFSQFTKRCKKKTYEKLLAFHPAH